MSGSGFWITSLVQILRWVTLSKNVCVHAWYTQMCVCTQRLEEDVSVCFPSLYTYPLGSSLLLSLEVCWKPAGPCDPPARPPPPLVLGFKLRLPRWCTKHSPPQGPCLQPRIVLAPCYTFSRSKQDSYSKGTVTPKGCSKNQMLSVILG